MNILVINPPNTPYTAEGLLIEPIDTLQLASCIKEQGFDLSVLDMDRKKMLTIPDTINYDWLVIVHDYHIPLHNESTILNIKAIISAAHRANKNVIMCGKYASFGDPHLLDHLGADHYIQGQAESKIVSILKGKDVTEYDNFTALPCPDRSLIDLSDYIDVRTVLTSRGCHQHCNFCHVPGFWGGWKYKRPEDVVSEIKSLYRTNQARKILFLDDNAIVNRERMIKICELLKAHNFEDLALGCLGSSDRMDEELLGIMYAAGFRWLHLGVENGDISAVIGTTKKINLQHTKQIIYIAKRIGFRVRCSFIVDLPGLDENSIKNTEQFILDTLPHEIRLHYLASRMGSKYHSSGVQSQTQFIHHPEPTITHDILSKKQIMCATEKIINALVNTHGYHEIKDVSEFNSLDILDDKNPELLLVAQCPIRYGLKWAR